MPSASSSASPYRLLRPAWMRDAAIALLFAAAYPLLGYIQFYHWLITDGLLFALLWASPRRRWPWLFVAMMLGRVLNGVVSNDLVNHGHGAVLGYWKDWTAFVLGCLLEPFLIAPGVLALQRWGVVPGVLVDARAIARLHMAAAVSAVAVVAKDVLYVINDGFIADVTLYVIHGAVPLGQPGSWELVLRFAIKNFMGCFVGILLIAPVTFWAISVDDRVGSVQVLRDTQRSVLPVALLFLLLGTVVRSAPLAEVLRLLLLAVIAVAAVREGWRGAALAVLTVSIAVAIDDYAGQTATNPIQLQMFIAISGAMGLMFGAAIDEMRRQRRQLDEAQTRTLALAGELANAAAGNLRAEERERHRIAGELHDEFGQNLTALQTYMQVLRDDLHRIDKSGTVDRLLDIIRSMRHNISGVLERLRPAALDELGLFGAIDRGTPRQLAQGASLDLDVVIEGDARLLSLLDDAHRIAAYRLAQESITNIVRHAHATCARVRLRIERRSGMLWLFVEVCDNGIGGVAHLRQGHGLTTMQDRVTALGGRLHLSDLHPGLRVHALLRQSLRGE